MLSLIGFEFKKFLSKRKNWVAIGACIILFIVFISLSFKLDIVLSQNELESIDLRIESIDESSIDIKNEMKKYPNNDKLKLIDSQYMQEVELLKAMKEAYISKEFSEVLEYKIKVDKLLIDSIEGGSVIAPIGIPELEDNIRFNSILLDKGIDPINTGTSMEGYNFIKLILSNPMSLIIIILIITISADIVSSEFNDNTYKLLFTQPIKKRNILISKLIANILINITTIFAIILISFIVLGCINGFGSIQYPTEFYSNGIIEYIEIGKFLALDILLFSMVVLFISSLTMLISSFSKSNSNSLALSIIVTISAYMISNKGYLNKMAHLNPFIYIDTSNVLQGVQGRVIDNVNINFEYGIVIMLLYTTILIISNIYFLGKKKSNY